MKTKRSKKKQAEAIREYSGSEALFVCFVMILGFLAGRYWFPSQDEVKFRADVDVHSPIERLESMPAGEWKQTSRVILEAQDKWWTSGIVCTQVMMLPSFPTCACSVRKVAE